jgi:hypothetical protein
MMFTKAMIALAAAAAVAAASIVPAIGASSKARASGQAKPQARVQYQQPGVKPGQGARSDGSPHSPNAASDVYVQGIYAGSDPDPRIRSYLTHDSPWNRTGP